MWHSNFSVVDEVEKVLQVIELYPLEQEHDVRVAALLGLALQNKPKVVGTGCKNDLHKKIVCNLEW